MPLKNKRCHHWEGKVGRMNKRERLGSCRLIRISLYLFSLFLHSAGWLIGKKNQIRIASGSLSPLSTRIVGIVCLCWSLTLCLVSPLLAADSVGEERSEAPRYRLTIVTEPPEAKVVIFNSAIPYEPGVRLPSGRYNVSVSHPGFEEEKGFIEVQSKDWLGKVVLHPLESPSSSPPDPALEQAWKQLEEEKKAMEMAKRHLEKERRALDKLKRELEGQKETIIYEQLELAQAQYEIDVQRLEISEKLNQLERIEEPDISPTLSMRLTQPSQGKPDQVTDSTRPEEVAGSMESDGVAGSTKVEEIASSEVSEEVASLKESEESEGEGNPGKTNVVNEALLQDSVPLSGSISPKRRVVASVRRSQSSPEPSEEKSPGQTALSPPEKTRVLIEDRLPKNREVQGGTTRYGTVPFVVAEANSSGTVLLSSISATPLEPQTDEYQESGVLPSSGVAPYVVNAERRKGSVAEDSEHPAHPTSEEDEKEAANSGSVVEKQDYAPLIEAAMRQLRAYKSSKDKEESNTLLKEQVTRLRRIAPDDPQVQTVLRLYEKRYLLIVGLFSDEGNAKDLIAQLASQGMQAYHEGAVVKGKMMYRVAVGLFEKREEAHAAKRMLEKKFKIKDVIVRTFRK